MVDLSVVGLLVALRFLALRGVPKCELKAGTRLLHLCGLFTLALNTAEPLLAGRYGRACLDTVAPLLLLGWGHVGPAFLAQFHTPPTLARTRRPLPLPLPLPLRLRLRLRLTKHPRPSPRYPPLSLPPRSRSKNRLRLQTSFHPSPAPRRPDPPPARPCLPPCWTRPGASRTPTAPSTEPPITAAHLGTRMGIALPVATAALAQLGAPALTGCISSLNPRPPRGLVRHAPSSNTPPCLADCCSGPPTRQRGHAPNGHPGPAPRGKPRRTGPAPPRQPPRLRLEQEAAA